MGLSAAHKAKISKANKGRKTPEWVKEKLSEAMTGRVMSQETKDKISAARKGVPMSEATKRKLSKRMSGRKKSEEHKAKISAARKGKAMSEETKRKISEALKGRKHPVGKKRVRLPKPKQEIIAFGYCGHCREKKQLTDLRMVTTKTGKTAYKGKCDVCGSGMFTFNGVPANA